MVASPKIVLLNDTSAWNHWGCTGTSSALKERIQGLGFDLQSIPIDVIYALKQVPQFEEFNNLQKFEEFCELNRDIINAIQRASGVVINGEGTLHGLGAAPIALLYLAHLSKKFFGKHVEIINHSVYPEDFSSISADVEGELYIAQNVYKTIYSELDFIAIRELLSHNEMRKLQISSTLSFDCLPLYIRDHYATNKQIKEKTLVIAGSAAFTEIWAEKICRCLESVAERGFRIKCLIGAAAFPSTHEQLLAHFLSAHCKASWDLVVAASMEEWLDTINHATLLVSGRFHHSIAAFCLNTPFIAFDSNTKKMQGLCASLGQEAPLPYLDPDLLDHLLLRVNAIISSPIVANGPKVFEICQLAERNFEGLKTLARLK